MPASFDIIVPTHNEAPTVGELYERLARLGFAERLIFVDNASTDGTLELIRKLPQARIVSHAQNEGYGASVRDGIAATEAEYVIILDADLEYPPESIPALLAALEDHSVVHCSRFLLGTPAMPLLRRLGNRAVTRLYNLLFRQRTSDLYSGMRGFRRESLPFASLQKPGFEHGAEMGAMIWLAGERIHDVAIEYQPRQHGHSKMRHLSDGLLLVGLIALYWLRCVVLRRPLHPDAMTTSES